VRSEVPHPPLTFPTIAVGKDETPPDLARLLYEGGASVPVDQADQKIRQGTLGEILSERVELVRRAHSFIEGMLTGGGSQVTARQQIKSLVHFFAQSEKQNLALSLPEVQASYLNWSEHLLHRVKVVKNLKQISAYNYARLTGQILDGALDRRTPLIELTRLKRPTDRKTPQGAKADKQVLHETFSFGRLLQDICDGLSLKSIWGPRPVSISLHAGGEIEVCKTGGNSTRPEEERQPSNVRVSAAAALAYQNDRSLDHAERRNLVNLRIQAELLMFIGQTGMNLAQAQELPLHRFNYSSDIDGYKVREYKPRRQGEVLFEIYSEYRSHFERYLEWRKTLFPESEQRLFPLIRRDGVRKSRRPAFASVQAACKKAGVTWVPPSTLRGTRVNWLLRRSGDPDMTADMAQHFKQTLIRVYEKPSLQVAVSEITRFHLRHDPVLAGQDSMLSVAPGECDGIPVASPAKPASAPKPDCRQPSGCLWCEHHRDIDSLDYVWSLACFRHLKVLELSGHRPPTRERDATHPADDAIARMSEKLAWFRDSNATRREWVEEALTRVEEGDYHEQWSYLIEAVEGSVA